MRRVRETVADLDVGRFAWSLHRELNFSILRGFLTSEPRGLTPGWDRIKQFLDACEHHFRIEVPCQRHDRVIGNIKGAIVIIEVLARDCPQVCHIANDFMVIRMDAKCRLLHYFTKPKKWLILIALDRKSVV